MGPTGEGSSTQLRDAKVLRPWPLVGPADTLPGDVQHCCGKDGEEISIQAGM